MRKQNTNSIKPFWSWNDALTREELEHQIVAMKESGIDGFFMHARGGLETPYMGDEWFRMIECCLNKADELDMQAWAYDENGWPSGFANGLVPALGVQHQQKVIKYVILNETNLCDAESECAISAYRRVQEGFVLTDNPLSGDYLFYYEVNPYYIDTFNRETVAHFLQFTHDQYYEKFAERFGNSLQGFFTDEPQYRFSPWSFCFPEEFRNRYGYDLLEKLPLLFFEECGYEALRSDFREMVAQMFRDSFIKQMYDWFTAHNCKLTGHMMNENNLHSQMRTTGGVMPCYEYFHEPGMDHLGRKIETPAQPKQVGSVAAQLGRKTMTETFGLCGWDVSLNELKWIAQWQYLNGVTSLCPHLEGYSLRGCRKRDYPPSLFVQLPWFQHVYKDFADYFTSLGKLLDSGKDIAPVLLIHPIHSAYILHSPFDDGKLLEYSEQFDALTEEFNARHILHHYGDETIMEHYGSVEMENDIPVIRVGNCSYHEVVLPNTINLTSSTVDMLLAFSALGGRVFALGYAPEFENGRRTEHIGKLQEIVTVCECLEDFQHKCKDAQICKICDRDTGCNSDNIHLSMKEMPDGTKLLYLINNRKSAQSVCVEIQGQYTLHYCNTLGETLESLPVRQVQRRTLAELDFAEYGSMLIKLEPGMEVYDAHQQTVHRVTPEKRFAIKESDDNALTLDRCIYRLDDGAWQPEKAVINLHNEVLALQRPCKVEMQFSFRISEGYDFSEIMLCMETPQKYSILINGQAYDFRDEGSFLDHSIRKSSIGELLSVGENTITLSCLFTQSPELYYAKFTPGVHESVLNKLTYDTELESIYLTGPFGVAMDEAFYFGERRCIHAGKAFRLTKLEKEVDITDITHQGYWFFSGQMKLMQTITVRKKANERYLLSLKQLNAPAAKVFINGVFAGNLMFAPFELDISDFLQDGDNELVIQLLSGNRNLLGPHHKPQGESYSVGPDSFSDQYGWTDDKTLPAWTDNYNFVIFGCEP